MLIKRNQNEWKSFNLPTQTWKNHIVFAYFWMFYPKLVHFFVCFLEKSLLSFREKSYFFEKNVISRKILFFFRKRQDFLPIFPVCTQPILWVIPGTYHPEIMNRSRNLYMSTAATKDAHLGAMLRYLLFIDVCWEYSLRLTQVTLCKQMTCLHWGW